MDLRADNPLNALPLAPAALMVPSPFHEAIAAIVTVGMAIHVRSMYEQTDLYANRRDELATKKRSKNR